MKNLNETKISSLNLNASIKESKIIIIDAIDM